MTSRLALLIVAVSIGCGPKAESTENEKAAQRPFRSGTLVEVFGNESVLATVRDAESGSAWRLDPSEEPLDDLHGPQYRADWAVEDYAIASGPDAVAPDLLDQLREAVLDLSGFEFEPVGCRPDFGYRVRFRTNDDAVDLLFCFNCDLFIVFHDSQVAGGVGFPYDNDRILRVMKQIFPDDPTIQSLELSESAATESK